MRMSRIVIIAVAVFVIAISTSVWQGTPTHQVTATDQPFSGQFVSVAPASAPVTNNSSALPAAQKRERVANCNNPVVRDDRKLTREEQDAFVSAVTEKATTLKRIELDKAVADSAFTKEEADQEMADFTANALPTIKEQAQASAPVEEVVETIFVDDPEAVGEAPSADQDPDGTKTRDFAEKVKARGCKNQPPFRSAGGRLAAPAAATYPAGTKSCTNSHTLKNSVGGTLAKVTQTSSWYSNSSGLPSNPRKSFSTTAGWGWDEKGQVQGGGPTVTVSYGVPLQYYSWTGQNFHFERWGWELYTWYGEVEQWFGYSKYGPRCSSFWWRP